jgi:hypothetical protein
MEKAQFFPIQCDNISLEFLSQNNLTISSLPCKYLGLPLHIKKLAKYLLQEVIQKIAKMLPGWQRGFLTHPGRETLIKSVLSTMSTYFLTVFKTPKWGFIKIDKVRRSFLWKGKDFKNVKAEHCLVN